LHLKRAYPECDDPKASSPLDYERREADFSASHERSLALQVSGAVIPLYANSFLEADLQQ
jgi:hypothetical protein